MDITYYKKYEPIFGSWRIVKEIGEGSYGKVFEIERKDFGHTYKAALKAITIPQNRNELRLAMEDGMDEESASTYFRGFVEDMVDEFALMSKLKGNSNIVSYEDHFVIQHVEDIGWDILIRMELLTPLTRYIRNDPLDRDGVIRLGIDICKALELCRKHNIVHRDIKPDNIFISDDGQFKLGDFGIAKTMEHTTGSIGKKGTFNYMAPEIYKGEEYGPRVDIYSLGIMLYRYMNNGRLPFQPPAPEQIRPSDNEKAIRRRVNGEDIPAPVNADEDFASVILKACAYKPADRYSSPVEMREALEAISEDFTKSSAVEPRSSEVREDKTVGIILVAKPNESEIPTAQETVADEISAFVNQDIFDAEAVKESGKYEDNTVSVFDNAKNPAEKDNEDYITVNYESERVENSFTKNRNEFRESPQNMVLDKSGCSANAEKQKISHKSAGLILVILFITIGIGIIILMATHVDKSQQMNNGTEYICIANMLGMVLEKRVVDADGYEAHSFVFYENGALKEARFDFSDGQGRLYREEFFSPEGDLNSVLSRELDKSGEYIVCRYDASGVRTSMTKYSITWDYQYDENGKFISRTRTAAPELFWKEDRVNLNNWNVNPKAADGTIENCIYVKFDTCIYDCSNTEVLGEQYIYIKDSDGNWKYVDSFVAENEEFMTVEVEFDEPISFSEIAVVPSLHWFTVDVQYSFTRSVSDFKYTEISYDYE